MSNMSYCRFENTSSDLDDCLDHMGDDHEDMSEHEIRGRESIIRTSVRIALDFGHEVNMPVVKNS